MIVAAKKFRESSKDFFRKMKIRINGEFKDVLGFHRSMIATKTDPNRQMICRSDG